ncbi:MAG: hypothetical protein D6732_22230 [Methanobacteriota archaeon]|nr:MAG: hypothetical protein D6732_22230 [Euryarchaeota archaeon]
MLEEQIILFCTTKLFQLVDSTFQGCKGLLDLMNLNYSLFLFFALPIIYQKVHSWPISQTKLNILVIDSIFAGEERENLRIR